MVPFFVGLFGEPLFCGMLCSRPVLGRFVPVYSALLLLLFLFCFNFAPRKLPYHADFDSYRRDLRLSVFGKRSWRKSPFQCSMQHTFCEPSMSTI